MRVRERKRVRESVFKTFCGTEKTPLWLLFAQSQYLLSLSDNKVQLKFAFVIVQENGFLVYGSGIPFLRTTAKVNLHLIIG
jgi:hypothetical protein